MLMNGEDDDVDDDDDGGDDDGDDDGGGGGGCGGGGDDDDDAYTPAEAHVYHIHSVAFLPLSVCARARKQRDKFQR